MGCNRRDQAKKLPGLFLGIPRPMLEVGGGLDVLSGDAFKLLVLLLHHGEPAHGGTRGERIMPYSYVQRRFKWRPEKVARTFNELVAAGYIERVLDDYGRAGGLRSGEMTPSKYIIGAAHPWSERATASPVRSGIAAHARSGVSPTASDARSGANQAKSGRGIARLAEWKAKNGA